MLLFDGSLETIQLTNCIAKGLLDFNVSNCIGRNAKYIEDITWPRGDTKFLLEC